MKNRGTAYLIWFIACFVGAHRFYLGKPFTGLLQAFTFGGFFIWALLDIFLIPSMVRKANKDFIQENQKHYE